MQTYEKSQKYTTYQPKMFHRTTPLHMAEMQRVARCAMQLFARKFAFCKSLPYFCGENGNTTRLFLRAFVYVLPLKISGDLSFKCDASTINLSINPNTSI